MGFQGKRGTPDLTNKNKKKKKRKKEKKKNGKNKSDPRRTKAGLFVTRRRRPRISMRGEKEGETGRRHKKQVPDTSFLVSYKQVPKAPPSD